MQFKKSKSGYSYRVVNNSVIYGDLLSLNGNDFGFLPFEGNVISVDILGEIIKKINKLNEPDNKQGE